MAKHRAHASNKKGAVPAVASLQSNSVQPPISGIGMSSDALVFMFPLLNKLMEKGAELPFRFPDTVLYEHHFPRGWFSVEREPEAAAALRRGTTELSPVEQLRGASPFLQPTVSTDHGRKGGTGPQKLVLVRRVAKECDSGIIRKAFSATRASPVLAALCVSRHPSTEELQIRCLDDAGLAEALLSSPETCLLSKMVPSRRPQFDLLVATWTPSVFSVEHRQNRHMLHDEMVPIQTRGDTTTPSQYQELQCSSLTAERIRDSLFAFMSCVATVERKYIAQIRVYFRTDHKERLWFLWSDVCRFATPRSVSGLHVMVKGGENPSELWDRIEREVAWRKSVADQRSAAARITGSGPAQERGDESESKKLDRLCDGHYGKHPSFIKMNGVDVDPETAEIVDAKLRRMIDQARGKSPSPVKRRALAAMNTSSPIDRGGKLSWASRRYLTGTSWEKPSAQDGLVPMVPLSMQPVAREKQTLPISSFAISTAGSSPTNMSSSGKGSPTRTGKPPTLNSEPLGDMTCSVVGRSGIFRGITTSPAFPPSEESPTRDAVSSLGEKRRSIIKVASRSQEAQGTPSKWMRAVRTISAANAMILETPRRKSDEVPSRGRDRSESFSSTVLMGAHTADEENTNDTEALLSIGGLQDGAAAVRPFVPSEARLNRARASFVLSKQADLLDISSRLEYNELKRVHAAAIAELDDLEYFCSSEALKSRDPQPIMFDLPKGTPPVPVEVMRRMGFSLVAEDPEMDRMYIEKYFFMSHGLHIAWAFEHLAAAVEDLCYQEELHYWHARIRDAKRLATQLREEADAAPPVVPRRLSTWDGVGHVPSLVEDAGERAQSQSRRKSHPAVTIASPSTVPFEPSSADVEAQSLRDTELNIVAPVVESFAVADDA